MIIRVPDAMLCWTDGGRDDNAVEIGIANVGDSLKIALSATSSPIVKIALRWNVRLVADAKVLGDHWERGYGDLGWRGIVPERNPAAPPLDWIHTICPRKRGFGNEVREFILDSIRRHSGFGL